MNNIAVRPRYCSSIAVARSLSSIAVPRLSPPMTLPYSFSLPGPLQGTRSVEGSPNEQGLGSALPYSQPDIEKQIPESGETEADSEEKKKATRDCNPVRWLILKCNIDPQGRFIRTWDLIVLLSCLIAVSVDPLFFYLPVINEDRKCLTSDNRLKITATCLRSVLDFISLSDIILRFICPFTDEDAPGQQHGQTNLVKDAWPIAKRYLFSRYFLIDILAILPAPQVAVPIIFSDVGSQTYWKMFLGAVVLFQYVLRIFRLWSKVDKSATIFKAVSWWNAGNYFYLYLFASYVLGAFWYFSSIQRLMDCWNLACKHHKGCNPSSFLCDHGCSSSLVALLVWTVIGHGVFEKRAPALLDNLVQAFLMAPFFVLLEVLQTIIGYEPYPGFHASVKAKIDADLKEWNSKKQKKLS